jgi:septum site-determining protein MinC
MPTLRLDRRDDSSTLQVKIAHALSSPANGIQSMLRGKPTRTAGCLWTVPIVLDLAALIPDGSHHYIKPEQGRLVGVVRTLRDFGIVVVGVCNTPHELEMEAIQKLGLPLLMPKGVVPSDSLKVRLEDVVHMVLAKRQECAEDEDEAIIDFDDTANAQPVQELPSQEEPKVVRQVENNETPNETPENIAPPQHELQTPPPRQPPLPSNSFVFNGSVRSGQQVAADKGQALVIIGSVNSGGEVLSDGDIYVFGKLRGRALAGLACSHDAKIVATSFDPELICIGDTFTTVDNVKQFGLKRADVPAMVSLSSEGVLVVEEIIL